MGKINTLHEKRTINETENPRALNIINLYIVRSWVASHWGLRYRPYLIFSCNANHFRLAGGAIKILTIVTSMIWSFLISQDLLDAVIKNHWSRAVQLTRVSAHSVTPHISFPMQFFHIIMHIHFSYLNWRSYFLFLSRATFDIFWFLEGPGESTAFLFITHGYYNKWITIHSGQR